MASGVFVTGTNTGVGKTEVTAGMLRLLAAEGVRAVGLKPIATGARPGTPLRNPDALALQAAAPVDVAYDIVNPWCFEPAIAPHLAAEEAGVTVTLGDLVAWYERATVGAELALVEGAGGWRVPLHPVGFLSDLPETLKLPVILVVGLTLGCLNHARLTAEAITGSGRCRLLGWVANAIDPSFERAERNVETLSDLLGSPPLARVPWLGPHPVPVDLSAADSLRSTLLSLR